MAGAVLSRPCAWASRRSGVRWVVQALCVVVPIWLRCGARQAAEETCRDRRHGPRFNSGKSLLVSGRPRRWGDSVQLSFACRARRLPRLAIARRPAPSSAEQTTGGRCVIGPAPAPAGQCHKRLCGWWCLSAYGRPAGVPLAASTWPGHWLRASGATLATQRLRRAATAATAAMATAAVPAFSFALLPSVWPSGVRCATPNARRPRGFDEPGVRPCWTVSNPDVTLAARPWSQAMMPSQHRLLDLRARQA